MLQATVSHEMKNPLKSIIAFCEYIITNLIPADGSRKSKSSKTVEIRLIVEQVSSAANLMLLYVHDLLDITAFKLGKF